MKEEVYRATNTLLRTLHINRLHPLETDNGPALATDTRCTNSTTGNFRAAQTKLF